jgi:hypothetical protein
MACAQNPAPATLPRVQVSENRRFLVTETGEPFFWLGDTAWELFHRLSREEAARYFANRQEKHFSVIQAVVLAEFGGLNTPNVYGERPLLNNDPARPNEAYFACVDELIQMAAAHELYVGLLPTWGDKVTPIWGVGPQVFDQENARAYGHFLGQRYRDQTNIIWILGGDRPAVHEGTDYRPIWRAMAAGIDEGTGGVALMTYHPTGGHSTSEWLHEEPWLDVNMMQSGHGAGHDVPVWAKIEQDYDLRPIKPTLDGEPNYEDHPVSPWPEWDPADGYYRDYDVRKQLYQSVFAGGCGVTYGHHSIWQFYDAGRELINYAERYWTAALDRPGAQQVQHLRALVESRPYLTRIPDQGILASDAGQGGEHVRATRDEDGSYVFVYLPIPLPVTVKLDALSGDTANAWWYDPCSGRASLIDQFPTTGTQTFTPPGHRPDWVLVLDDAARDFVPPGTPS